jgi:hypothetical protein
MHAQATHDTASSPGKLWWRRFWIGLAVIVAALLLLLALQIAGVMAGDGSGLITISEETTHATGPLGPDGMVDYAAVINLRSGEGVTPETNAAVGLLEALGPNVNGIEPAFHLAMCEALGIQPLPVAGDYLIDEGKFFEKWVAENTELPENEQRERVTELFDERSAASEKPWTADDYPEVDALMRANQIPLDKIVEAVKRPHYYRPLVFADSSQPNSLIAALLPDVQMHREIARQLTARAMWHLGQNNVDAAIEDLLASHRLARHIVDGSTMIETLVGCAIDSITFASDQALYRHTGFTAEHAQQFRETLQELGPVATPEDMSRVVDYGERYMGLDVVQGLAVGDLGTDDLGIGLDGGATVLVQRLARLGMNWNATLIVLNEYYDEMAAYLALPTRKERMAGADASIAKLEAMKPNGDWTDIAGLVFVGPTGRGKKVGHVLLMLLAPAGQQFATACDRAAARWRVNLVGLAAYQYKLETRCRSRNRSNS